MKAPLLQSATSGFSLLRSVIKLGRIDEKQRLGIGAQSKSHDKMFSLSDDPPAQPQTTLPGDLGSRRLTREESRLARVEAEEKVLTMSMMFLKGVPKELLI